MSRTHENNELSSNSEQSEGRTSEGIASTLSLRSAVALTTGRRGLLISEERQGIKKFNGLLESKSLLKTYSIASCDCDFVYLISSSLHMETHPEDMVNVCGKERDKALFSVSCGLDVWHATRFHSSRLKHFPSSSHWGYSVFGFRHKQQDERIKNSNVQTLAKKPSVISKDVILIYKQVVFSCFLTPVAAFEILHPF